MLWRKLQLNLIPSIWRIFMSITEHLYLEFRLPDREISFLFHFRPINYSDEGNMIWINAWSHIECRQPFTSFAQYLNIFQIYVHRFWEKNGYEKDNKMRVSSKNSLVIKWLWVTKDDGRYYESTERWWYFLINTDGRAFWYYFG